MRLSDRALSQDEIDALALRMAKVAITSRIEGASDDQMRYWMRTALYRHLNHGEELEEFDPGTPTEEQIGPWTTDSK